MTDREKELERLLRETVDYFNGSPMPTPVRAARAFLASSPAPKQVESRESAWRDGTKHKVLTVSDVEWCNTCRMAQLQLGWDGHVYDGPCRCPDDEETP